jgi:hypothetical protein
MRSMKLALVLPVLLAGLTASAQTTPTITFDYPAWNEVASPSPLPYGKTAKIVYDANRLSQCRGTTNTGGPAWTITGYYQINGGPVQNFWVAGHNPAGGSTTPPSISLSAKGALSMWFQVTNIWGCNAWDSNYGANYSFNIN